MTIISENALKTSVQPQCQSQGLHITGKTHWRGLKVCEKEKALMFLVSMRCHISQSVVSKAKLTAGTGDLRSTLCNLLCSH